MNPIEFQGRLFYQDPDQLYFRAWNPEKGRPDYLHRCIWEAANGPILDGFHNSLENLEALSVSAHKKEHWHLASAAQRQARESHLSSIRPLAAEWHKSEEGRHWHSEKAKLELPQRVHLLNCAHCKKEVVRIGVIQEGRFCSNACKAAHRRASGVDNETRRCAYCANPFLIDRYKKTQTCSRACANRKRHADRKS